MWYSLDQWGKDHSNSTVPQCYSATDCFGDEYASEKCCASISMSEEMVGAEDLYIYRCLDMGLIGMDLDFKIGSDMQVNV